MLYLKYFIKILREIFTFPISVILLLFTDIRFIRITEDTRRIGHLLTEIDGLVKEVEMNLIKKRIWFFFMLKRKFLILLF